MIASTQHKIVIDFISYQSWRTHTTTIPFGTSPSSTHSFPTVYSLHQHPLMHTIRRILIQIVINIRIYSGKEGNAVSFYLISLHSPLWVNCALSSLLFPTRLAVSSLVNRCEVSFKLNLYFNGVLKGWNALQLDPALNILCYHSLQLCSLLSNS